MFSYIQQWRDARRRRVERDAFNEGFAWANTLLVSGTATPESIEALTHGVFNTLPQHWAFDRGAQAALAEHAKRTAK